MTNNTYIVYETTNLINGKYYIGVHKVNGKIYYGSGVALNRSIKKYGKDNFTVDVLKSFSSKEEAYEEETRIVNEDLVNNPNSYNISLGGFCGPCLYGEENPRYGTTHRKDTITKMKKKAIGRFHNEETKSKLSSMSTGKNNSNYGLIGELNPKFGSKATEETKKKMSEAKKGSNAYNSKKWVVYGVTYNSLTEASDVLGSSRQTISNWCKVGGKYKKQDCYNV